MQVDAEVWVASRPDPESFVAVVAAEVDRLEKPILRFVVVRFPQVDDALVCVVVAVEVDPKAGVILELEARSLGVLGHSAWSLPELRVVVVALPEVDLTAVFFEGAVHVDAETWIACVAEVAVDDGPVLRLVAVLLRQEVD